MPTAQPMEEEVEPLLQETHSAYKHKTRLTRIFSRFVWAVPPVIVAIAMLIWFLAKDVYPFSQKSIAYSDMAQQYVPLLCSFKDILAGKDGFFFSIRNGAGMNFYGVFFYYLASPFTFLVTFVDKADMWGFANILVLLKMCTISATASYYLSKKYPSAPLLNVFLSVLYAYSGYVMMNYQIAAWLDVMYLFPFLLLGLERLKEGKRALFIFALTASVVVNFYLGYMLIIFLFLYAFVYLLMSKDRRFAGAFVLACVVAALLSAIVWLPSLLQYFSSGRKTSIVQSLAASEFFAPYETTLLTVFSFFFLFPFALCPRKKEDKDGKLRQILLLAMLVPMIIEPINKMWHTGNYMCFPTRYGFMPLFLCVTLAMDKLALPMHSSESATVARACGKMPPDQTHGERFLTFFKTQKGRSVVNATLLALSVGYCCFAIIYTDCRVATMDEYSSSRLYSSKAALGAMMWLYGTLLAIGFVLFFIHHYSLTKRILVWVSVGVLVFSELYVAPMIYMSNPASNVEGLNKYNTVVPLADNIDDDSFYRVKTNRKYFDVLLVSAMGYNALGHFTSLTNGDYMKAVKQFGYSSYWMEVGNDGGTMVTDALLSVKYQINTEKLESGEYISDIASTPVGLPLGVVAREGKDIIQTWQTTQYTDRGTMQETLYEDFFGENDCVTNYTLEDATLEGVTVEKTGDGMRLIVGDTPGTITFKVPVTEKERLYFNVFDLNDNSLAQAMDECFEVYETETEFIFYGFPKQGYNGLLEIGGFTDRTVEIGIKVYNDAVVREFGVVGVKEDRLVQAAKGVKTLNLQSGSNKIYGVYEAKGGESVFLSVPYDSGFTLKINGTETNYYKVYDGFIGFYLQEGENYIELTYTSPGFTGGLFLTIFGSGLCLAAFVLCKWKKLSLRTPRALEKLSYYGLVCAGIAVITVIYVMPLLLVMA